jgi:hypothetical protein
MFLACCTCCLGLQSSCIPVPLWLAMLCPARHQLPRHGQHLLQQQAALKQQQYCSSQQQLQDQQAATRMGLKLLMRTISLQASTLTA